MTMWQPFLTIVNYKFPFLIWFIGHTHYKGNDPLDQKNTVPPFFRFWGDVIERAKHISFVNSSHICIIVGNSFWTWHGLHTTISIFTLYIRRLCAMEIRNNMDRLIIFPLISANCTTKSLFDERHTMRGTYVKKLAA